MKICLNQVKQLVDRFKTRIFCIILQRIISKQFSVDIGILFQNCFIARAISHANAIFQPLVGQKGKKKGREQEVKIRHFQKNDIQKWETCLDTQFCIKYLIVASIFIEPCFSTLFGRPSWSNGRFKSCPSLLKYPQKFQICT